MTIKTLIEKFKFTWNEDGTMLTLEGISLSDLNEILKGFKILHRMFESDEITLKPSKSSVMR